MDGTEIIDEEHNVPAFDPQKDYSSWKAGAPVWDEVAGEHQVFTLLISHNASHYPGTRPNNNRTLWNLTHTKDPKKTKVWVAPDGQSGRYAVDECCTENDRVYKNTYPDNEFSPSALADRWIDLEPIEEVQNDGD